MTCIIPTYHQPEFFMTKHISRAFNFCFALFHDCNEKMKNLGLRLVNNEKKIFEDCQSF